MSSQEDAKSAVIAEWLANGAEALTEEGWGWINDEQVATWLVDRAFEGLERAGYGVVQVVHMPLPKRENPMFEKFKSLVGTFRDVVVTTKSGQQAWGRVEAVDHRMVTLCPRGPRGDQNPKTVMFDNIDVIEVRP